MAILVFVETAGGEIKKTSLAAVSYGAEVAKSNSDEVIAVVAGPAEGSVMESIGEYGANKVLHINDDRLEKSGSRPYITAVAAAAEKAGAATVIMSRSSLVNAIASPVATRLGAAMVSNIVALPDTSSGFKVKTSIYTGKAFANINVKADKKVLTITKNAIEPVASGGAATVETLSVSFPDSDFSADITEVKKADGDLLLSEADLVVSGGRGLKGPENWGMIEELAKVLGAATGCSKPVSDMDWRPHHEHVGQTGIKVSPNLYIAIGISGAIQHLAGVNSSKYIVVINTDAEAPFFKAADYGIVGDAFEVVPKLIEALKANG